MTVDQIRKAVTKSLLEGEGWPPSLPEFIKFGKDLGINADESFDKFINARSKSEKSQLSDVEYFTAQEVGDRCRTKLSEDKARKVWADTQKKYAQRQADGKLPQRNQQAIEHTKKRVGRDWLAPDGNYYTCPSEYHLQKLRAGK